MKEVIPSFELAHFSQVGPNGELLVSLNYLPAAKRLTVGIMKARHLAGVVKKDKQEQLPGKKVALFLGNSPRVCQWP